MKISSKCRVEPGERVRLANWDPAETFGFKKKDVVAVLEQHLGRIVELQEVLYAERKQSLLIALQAMDAGGKDGAIKHVMRALNPQGCRVTSFRKPTPEEAVRPPLWRYGLAIPAQGEISIFNRSHYEDVLVVRVHNFVPREVWSQRYAQINNWEKYLAAYNVRIIKFFLHVSKDEQKKRFQQRIDNPTKHWKISPNDFEERKYWDDYMEAFEDLLTKCSTEWAPWYIIPSDRKWFRNYAVAEIVARTLEAMAPKFPAPQVDISKIQLV